MLDMSETDTAADLYARAVALVRAEGRASTTFLQKSFSIGYNKATALIERLEAEGIVSPADALGKRAVQPEPPTDAPAEDWLSNPRLATYRRAAEADKPEPRPAAANPADVAVTISAGGAEVQTTMANLIAMGKVDTGGKVPVKNTAADKAVSNGAYAITADELRQFIERYEHLAAEKQDIAEQQKDVMAEAKGRGFNTKVIRKIIALRKRNPDDMAEEDAVLDLYKQALGMEPTRAVA